MGLQVPIPFASHTGILRIKKRRPAGVRSPFMLAAMVAIPLLFGASIALGGSSMFLVFALSTQLVSGLWILLRLLIHRN